MLKMELDKIQTHPPANGNIWFLTILIVAALFLFDFFAHTRKAHEPTLKESLAWSMVYIGAALGFGVFLFLKSGSAVGVEYFAGYVTEKALSIDNLFIFIIIMQSFNVPRASQAKALHFGILFALITRTVFIFLGAALINSFSWIFYFFGIILLWTAVGMATKGDEQHGGDNFIIRFSRRFLTQSSHYDGDKLLTLQNGKKVLTPMILVMIAIGGTDLIFALDSIPAIFGLTQDPYIVFTANAFALMGMRQLYFLIDGLLARLIYLSYGLAIILAFIGVKLILHALYENNLPFINGGQGLDVPEIGTGVSLIVILGVLFVTVVASLLFGPSAKGKNKSKD